MARRTVENAWRRRGFPRVAGADEVGRGSLAGPVVAAAVVLDPGARLPGLRDSKLLTASERERLYAAITRTACWAVAEASAATVDRVNVHQASLVAIRQALEADHLTGFGLYTLGAADTRCPEPTMELVRRFRPDLARMLTAPLPGRAPLLAINRAHEAFGYHPRFRLGD